MAGTDRGTVATEPRPRAVSLIAALITAALVAAGCGGETETPAPAIAGESAPASSPTTSTAATATTTAPTTTTTTAAPTSSAPATTAAPTTSSTSTTTSTISATATTATPTATVSETTESDTTSTESETTTESGTIATPTTEPPPPTTVAVEVPRPEASTVAELIALDRPLVIAHAGGDQDYPHSTIYAYTQSALAGADILELDVQLTADGVLIVQHDDTVDRTTEASGPVADLTLAGIRALDNAHWFVAGRWGDQTRPDSEYEFRGVRTGEVDPPPGFGPDDFRVATFREVAERFPHHVLDVEIKLQRGDDDEEDPATGIAAAEVLAAEIAELGREDSVIVACFNDDVLAAFGRLAPAVVATPGETALVGWFLAGEALDPDLAVVQVPFTYGGIEVVTPDTVARVHDEGREVWVWLSGTDVVETREFYSDLFALGVDGVLAGRPAEARAALDAAVLG